MRVCVACVATTEKVVRYRRGARSARAPRTACFTFILNKGLAFSKNLVHLASSSAAQCVGPLLGSSGGARFGLDWVTTAVAIVVVACAAAVGGMGAAPDAVQRRLML